MHLVGFVYIITYEAWYTQRQNMLYIVNLQLMGASYDQWEFQIHINFYRNKTVNLNISRFCKRKNLHTFIELWRKLRDICARPLRNRRLQVVNLLFSSCWHLNILFKVYCLHSLQQILILKINEVISTW